MPDLVAIFRVARSSHHLYRYAAPSVKERATSLTYWNCQEPENVIGLWSRPWPDAWLRMQHIFGHTGQACILFPVEKYMSPKVVIYAKMKSSTLCRCCKVVSLEIKQWLMAVLFSHVREVPLMDIWKYVVPFTKFTLSPYQTCQSQKQPTSSQGWLKCRTILFRA